MVLSVAEAPAVQETFLLPIETNGMENSDGESAVFCFRSSFDPTRLAESIAVAIDLDASLVRLG